MRIGVLTGGGDCAGLNAAIRAVVRASDARFGSSVVGYRGGWEGVACGDRIELDPDAVRGVVGQGGTMLGTSRSAPRMLDCGAAPLLDQLVRDQVDGLVAIGGDGTLHVTDMLDASGFPVVALPKTIDNDVEGTDVSIGFDTALAVATDAVDRLHTTAASHDRLMVLEVMGRHAGHLAAGAGIAGGAAAVLVPECPVDIEAVADQIVRRHEVGRCASVVVVAEGASALPIASLPIDLPTTDAWGNRRLAGTGETVARQLADLTGFETRTTVLGHIQRGGSPTATDRLVASRLGAVAVDALAEGIGGVLAGIDGPRTKLVPLGEVVGKSRCLPPEMIELLDPLTTAPPTTACGHQS